MISKDDKVLLERLDVVKDRLSSRHILIPTAVFISSLITLVSMFMRGRLPSNWWGIAIFGALGLIALLIQMREIPLLKKEKEMLEKLLFKD